MMHLKIIQNLRYSILTKEVNIQAISILKNGIKISMNSKGRATDNIVIDRFLRSAKVERIYLNV